MKSWRKLVYNIPWMYEDMMEREHVLIGGTTGAGKSTALQGFIMGVLKNAPSEAQLMLIDPKGTELMEYELLPHTIGYAYEIADINDLLLKAERIRETRFQDMRKKRLKKYDGSHIYIVIDEYAALGGKYGEASKEAMKALNKIAFLGRAANIHIIACTQRPTSDVIEGLIKNNFTTTLALRTNTNQESRNLISIGACENLPTYGKAYYRTPSKKDLQLVEVPLVPETLYNQVIANWMNQR